MGNNFSTRVKLLLRDKAALFCYCVSVIVCVCVFLGLKTVAEERSAIPIGLIVEDESQDAYDLAERIRNKDTFYVYEKSKQELEEMLIDGYINSIFIIKDGFGNSIMAGDYEQLITVISAEDDKISVVLSDIMAGDMVYDICVNKAFNRYNRLDNPARNRSEYKEYVISFSERPEYTLPIDFEYIDAENGKIKEEAVTNGMIYRQMIAGMICMLVCIVAFTSCNQLCVEYEQGIVHRKNNLPSNKFLALFGDFLGILVFTAPLAITAGGVLAGLHGVIITLVYLVVILLVCFVLALTVKKLSAFQVVGVILVVGLGVCGFISAFSGLVGGGEFLKYTPNGLYIEWFISL